MLRSAPTALAILLASIGLVSTGCGNTTGSPRFDGNESNEPR
jgi:hypothetical protein